MEGRSVNRRITGHGVRISSRRDERCPDTIIAYIEYHVYPSFRSSVNGAVALSVVDLIHLTNFKMPAFSIP